MKNEDQNEELKVKKYRTSHSVDMTDNYIRDEQQYSVW